LLLSPPLGQKRILGIDPGFRTGCKVVCLDEQGNLLHNETIYPHPPQKERSSAMKKIAHLNVTKFGAFVDIGIKENGLVHISQLADRFVRNPTEVVSLHQHVSVKVLEVDPVRKRVGLSMKV
jgi:transcriptional accessory protein Tex/SPT6